MRAIGNGVGTAPFYTIPASPTAASDPSHARTRCLSVQVVCIYLPRICSAIHGTSKHDAFRLRRTRTLDRAYTSARDGRTIPHSFERASECAKKREENAHAPIAMTDPYTMQAKHMEWGKLSFCRVPPWHGARRQPAESSSPAYPPPFAPPQPSARRYAAHGQARPFPIMFPPPFPRMRGVP